MTPRHIKQLLLKFYIVRFEFVPHRGRVVQGIMPWICAGSNLPGGRNFLGKFRPVYGTEPNPAS